MYCSKKQIGAIAAVFTPGIICAAGAFEETVLVDPGFVQSGTWLSGMLGFVAIATMTGLQKQKKIPTPFFPAFSIGLALIGLLAALTIGHAQAGGIAESQVMLILWRSVFVIMLTGLVLSIFAIAQIAWRAFNARQAAPTTRLAPAYSGSLKGVSSR